MEPDGKVTDVQYGTRQFLALELDDPRRAAALIRAASAWRQHCADLPEWVVYQARTDAAIGKQLREEWDAEQAADWGLLAGWAKGLASVPTVEEQDVSRKFAPAREVRATTGWPPVAIPGRPGSWRHLIDGRQVDLPTRERLEVAA